MFGLSPIESILPFLFVGLMWAAIVGFPFLALAKLWQHARKQTQLLEEIKTILQQRP